MFSEHLTTDSTADVNHIPGTVIAMQTFGDLIGHNPHCHTLVTDGCFYDNCMFRVSPPFELKKLEAIFRHKVFKMLLAKGKITVALFYNKDAGSFVVPVLVKLK